MADMPPNTPTISVHDVLNACTRQKCGKSFGIDGIAMEAFVHGGTRLYIHMGFLFNLFIKFAYVPRTFMQCLIVPLVKCKTGNLSDVNNYRAIAISTAISKVFESVLSHFVKSCDNIDAYQFGFSAGHSTGLCTSVLKRTVDYYTERGSHVFVCFIDFSKAFDRVNYWKLLHKLLDDNVSIAVVRLLSFWYSSQEACVTWHNSTSQFFTLGNGTRQGGVLSPWFFARYLRELLSEVVGAGVGCNIGGLTINVLAYADDIVLIAPSWRGLQRLIDVVAVQSVIINMEVNVSKTVCMVFDPKSRSKIVSQSFPALHLGSQPLQYVPNFKYLGHKLMNTNMDDADIQREITNMFIRTNLLLRKFSKCSVNVKTVLFKSYCLCLYDASLWKRFNAGTLAKLRSCYNRCIKLFFGYKRRDSMTNIFLQLCLPTFDTVLINSAATFHCQWTLCQNRIVRHLCMLGY
jgi:hypothetical protein